MIIAIDPGHGGRDSGAVGFIREVDIVYPWADHFAGELERLGHDARFTHQRPGKHRKVSLRKRSKAANKMKADLYISIHADAWKTIKPEGASAFVYSKGSTAYRIAQAILPTLQEGIGWHGKQPKIANFYVLRKTHMPAILFEIGFVTNAEDALWLMYNYKMHAVNVVRALNEVI